MWNVVVIKVQIYLIPKSNWKSLQKFNTLVQNFKKFSRNKQDSIKKKYEIINKQKKVLNNNQKNEITIYIYIWNN